MAESSCETHHFSIENIDCSPGVGAVRHQYLTKSLPDRIFQSTNKTCSVSPLYMARVTIGELGELRRLLKKSKVDAKRRRGVHRSRDASGAVSTDCRRGRSEKGQKWEDRGRAKGIRKGKKVASTRKGRRRAAVFMLRAQLGRANRPFRRGALPSARNGDSADTTGQGQSIKLVEPVRKSKIHSNQ